MTGRLLWLLSIRYTDPSSNAANRAHLATTVACVGACYNNYVTVRATFFGFRLSPGKVLRAPRPFISHSGQIVLPWSDQSLCAVDFFYSYIGHVVRPQTSQLPNIPTRFSSIGCNGPIVLNTDAEEFKCHDRRLSVLLPEPRLSMRNYLGSCPMKLPFDCLLVICARVIQRAHAWRLGTLPF